MDFCALRAPRPGVILFVCRARPPRASTGHVRVSERAGNEKTVKLLENASVSDMRRYFFGAPEAHQGRGQVQARDAEVCKLAPAPQPRGKLGEVGIVHA